MEPIAAGEVVRMRLNKIRTDGGTQMRVTLDDERVAEYQAAMEDGAEFPPAIVFHDGTDYWLADGFHRYRAAEGAGFADLDVALRSGTRRDAILYAAGANAVHGLRRTNADKRLAVETLLRDEEWAAWSDREIARRAAVSHNFVSEVRRVICPPMTDAQPAARKVERAGTVYEQNTAAINRDRKPAAPRAAPRQSTPPPPPPPRVELSGVTDEVQHEADEFHDHGHVGALVLDAFSGVTRLMGRWPEDKSLRPLIAVARERLKEMEAMEAAKEKRRREDDAA